MVNNNFVDDSVSSVSVEKYLVNGDFACLDTFFTNYWLVRLDANCFLLIEGLSFVDVDTSHKTHPYLVLHSFIQTTSLGISSQKQCWDS